MTDKGNAEPLLAKLFRRREAIAHNIELMRKGKIGTYDVSAAGKVDTTKKTVLDHEAYIAELDEVIALARSRAK